MHTIQPQEINALALYNSHFHFFPGLCLRWGCLSLTWAAAFRTVRVPARAAAAGSLSLSDFSLYNQLHTVKIDIQPFLSGMCTLQVCRHVQVVLVVWPSLTARDGH